MQIEESAGRLKIILPLARSGWLFGLFSVLLLLWAAMLIWGVVFTFGDVAFSGERFAFVFTVMLVVWILVWLRFGRFLWGRWQYHAATREILFLEEERLIVRRPVSILGLTEAFDLAHISRIYISTRHGTPAFDYGHQHVYFGQDLDEADADRLVQLLSERVLPHLAPSPEEAAAPSLREGQVLGGEQFGGQEKEDGSI